MIRSLPAPLHPLASRIFPMLTRLKMKTWPVLLSVAMASALLGLHGCQQANQFVAPPPPTVTVAVPLRQPVQEYFETPGQTRAVQMVELRARVQGYLKEIHFGDGDVVTQGQLLFVIDQAPYKTAVQSAEAALAKATAQLQLADRQLARSESLAERNATTESSLDIQKAEQAAAVADVAAAQAALNEARLNLNYTEIRAPFAGRMGRHLVDIGNLVQSGETLLTSLESVDPIHAYFTISESDLLRFMRMREDGKIKISETEPLHVQLALSDTGEYNFDGQLDFEQFSVDTSTGTTQRRAIFPNADGRLIPGLFVRLRAAVGEPQDRLLIEERAIATDQRGDYVLVVSDKNVVEYRPVKVGLLSKGLRAIETGLNEADKVIVNGIQRARPGSPVTPELATMGAPPAAKLANTPSESAQTADSESKKTEE